MLITTRFPHDAALRFSREADFSDWSDRLEIYVADFRSLPHVRQLAVEIAKRLESLDILINNAAQTVRRPPAFYRHLLERESQSRSELPLIAQSLIAPGTSSETEFALTQDTQHPLANLHPATAMTQLPLLPEDAALNPEQFPPGQLDRDGQQVDRRSLNSWVQRLGDVSLGKLVEVHAVNCLAPYIFISCLEPLMLKPPSRDRYIVNVLRNGGEISRGRKPGFIRIPTWPKPP